MAAPERNPRTRKHLSAWVLLALLMTCTAHAEECQDGNVMISATKYRQVCLPVLLLPDETTFTKIEKGRIVQMRIGKLSEIQELPKGTISSPIPGTPMKPRPVN